MADDQTNLKNIRVLLDGYNIELTQGTGIKTYALTLASTLANLEANVSILTSRTVKHTKYPILKAVFFADAVGSAPSKKVLSIFMLRQFLKLGQRVRTLTNLDYPIFPPNISWASKYSIYNSPHCFDISNFLHQKINYVSTFNIRNCPQVFHATYPLPIKIQGAKKITTIHDLIPLRLPYVTLDDKKFFFENTQQSIKNSDLIFAVSEATKLDLLDTFDVHPDKIRVTYQPLMLKPLSIDETELLRDGNYYKLLELEYKGYILFVGAIEPKKNVGRLIDAYAGIDTDMPLVIVGKKAWLWEEQLARLDRLPSSKRSKIILLDYVSKADLRYLYAGAYCFVFPSLYEGFGIPVLEAMSFGCPVITSKVASLPEVGGKAALYIDPYNALDISMAMTRLLNSPSLCQSLIQNGHEQLEKFSQTSYERRIQEGYLSIL